eukprot:Transcript_16074.p2 GENE.Transcript_16074~~Transcript_16074.p2  ORF type:complete len:287 (+),score=87.52 Transcript_16074:333-1193(+)
MQNRTRKRRDEQEDEVQARTPVNPDEMLELRAVNDISTTRLSEIPELLSRRGSAATATLSQVLGGLREAVGEVKDEYVVERMLMAHPPAAGAGAVGGGAAHLDTYLAVASVMFLSSGPVAERLCAMHALLAEPSAAGGEEGVRPERMCELLDALKETGQVPVEQRVCTVDEGHNQLGIPLSYLRPQPVREFEASEWVAQWLQGGGGGEQSATPDPAPAAFPEGTRVELAAFIEMLTSESVCVWGECDNIRERKRLQKQREDADEYARNPPKWQVWKWEIFAGKRPE